MTDTPASSRIPEHVEIGDYGVDPETGLFRHPDAAPYVLGPRPVPGSLDYLEEVEYIHNMTVEGHWPELVHPGVSFQNIIDWEGRRYFYHYYRTRVNVYDITDPKNLKVALQKVYGPDEGFFGAAAINYNRRLGKWIMIQSIEVPRSGPLGLQGQKYTNPARAEGILNMPGLRGIRIFEMQNPIEWTQIAEISTDPLHPHGEVQQGSGPLDIPTYFGDKYVLLSAAPDNTFRNNEFPNYLYAPAHMVLDVEDPWNPRMVSSWWPKGQRLGEEAAASQWRQWGNQTSWIGARTPIALTRPLEQGTKYGYTVMGGLGFYVLDVSDPDTIREVGHLELPLSIGGIEGDHVDANRADTRGLVLTNGYPMNEDGYEPYKDVYIVDVKDPANPTIVGTLPRPVPPAEAPYSDYVLRRGKFGPKRCSHFSSPGTVDDNIVVMPFNTAGVQVFDISDPANAKIVAYFVPQMNDELNHPETHKTPLECLAVEWDRKLIWGVANSGLYLLSTPALGEPDFSPPPSGNRP